MRLIYIDEAGTAPKENVRVVAAVIIDGDAHPQMLINEMRRIFDERVPSQFRRNFIFHAKELMHPKKGHFADWHIDERLDLIKEVVCLPFVHDLPIAIGTIHRGILSYPQEEIARLQNLKVGTQGFEHAFAFSYCLERSDWFIRNFLNGEENGVVIVENVNEKRKLLRDQMERLINRPVTLSADSFRPSIFGKRAEPHTYKITNLLDVPHFVEKHEAPILQLADACAFSFRRFINGFSHGEDLIMAMLGPQAGSTFVLDPVWREVGSSGLFNTHAYKK